MKTVTRTWRATGEEFECFLPQMLSEGIMGGVTEFNAPEFQPITGVFGDFSLSLFTARYLAGDICLREARDVSRKRLALVTSGVGRVDNDAILLQRQIESYITAKEILLSSDEMTLDAICKVNALIAPNSPAPGMIREVQNWMGGTNPVDALFVPPPTDLMPEYMQDWIDFMNSSEYELGFKGLVGHVQLVNIHPFSDGNGRSSRLVMDAYFERAYGEGLHPSLFRLGNNNRFYVQSLKAFGIWDEAGLAHPFWNYAFKWGSDSQKEVHNILSATRRKLNARLGMMQLSPEAKRLYDHIWQQPIVCVQGLALKFDWNMPQIMSALTPLVEAGILTPRKLKQPENAQIFDSADIFDAWAQLDDLLFSKIELPEEIEEKLR